MLLNFLLTLEIPYMMTAYAAEISGGGIIVIANK